MQVYITRSEFSTLKFLETTAVPAPRIFYYAIESTQNPMSVTFVLMEKLQGVPLEWNTATPAQRSKVMEQPPNIFLELEKHPFRSSGSISTTDSDRPQIGGYAQIPLFEFHDTPIGPFDTLESSVEVSYHYRCDQ